MSDVSDAQCIEEYPTAAGRPPTSDLRRRFGEVLFEERIPEAFVMCKREAALQKRDHGILSIIETQDGKCVWSSRDYRNADASFDEVVQAARDLGWWGYAGEANGPSHYLRPLNRPKIICICGSTKFIETMAVKAYEFEKQGYISLSCHLLPAWHCPVPDHFAELEGVSEQLDALHMKKIEMADEIFVVNKDGYIGDQTRREIEYAGRLAKPINYLEPMAA